VAGRFAKTACFWRFSGIRLFNLYRLSRLTCKGVYA